MKGTGWIAITVFFLVYVATLGVRPITISDEARYAEIPREMIASGNWIVPRLDGVRYFEKPVMGYWLNAIAILLFGQNPFAVRFPSALSAGLCALMVHWMIRRSTRDAMARVLIPSILLTCILVVLVAVTAVLDMIVTMFLTGGMIMFFFSHLEPLGWKRTAFLILFGICCGLAFLTKGFFAFVIPVIVIGPFLLWEKDWKEVLLAPWLPLVCAILTAMPWVIAVHRQERDYWHYFFWVEHIQRFASAKAQHHKPFWYFIPVFVGLGLPWTAMIPSAVISFRKRTDWQQSLFRYGVCWFFMPLLFFSASRGKLWTYILPCFPPFAILVGFGLVESFKRGLLKAFDVGAVVFAGVSLISAAALLVFHTVGPEKYRLYTSEETFEWMLMIGALLATAALAGMAAREFPQVKKLLWYCLAPVPFFICAQFAIPDNLPWSRSAEPFLALHAHRVPDNGILVSDGFLVDSTCWFFKRDDVYLIGDGGELHYGLTQDDAPNRLLELEEFGRMIAENIGKRNITVVITASQFERYRNHLPKPAFEALDTRTKDPKRALFVQF
ncbi:MAG TPA: phospholipid carrier-dependent glycosyltransferase [Candidatus Binatia bacterium]